MKCVIPCAGKSTRMGLGIPKVLLDINGRNLLSHITRKWSTVVDGFIIIVSKENENLIRHNSGKAEFVVQDPMKGIADAILRAETFVNEGFIVNLGDCLHKGEFEKRQFEQGIGVLKNNSLSIRSEFRKSYSVEISKRLVVKVVEKPSYYPYLFCGMGVYFFQPKVFNYIRKTKPSPLRNEIEITDVIQNMIDAGEEISPIWFDGEYINITYPEDIKKAETIFK